MDNILVSSFEEKTSKGFFLGIKQTKGAKNRDFSQIVKCIKTSEYFRKTIGFLRNQIDKSMKKTLKENLPYFTPSGTFSVRNESSMMEYSGLVHIDIDNLDVNEIDAIRKRILDHFQDYVFCLFISPSGCGLKVFFRVFEQKNTHKLVFIEIKKHFEFLNIKIDSSCNDLSRACFYSYDPEVFYNPFSEKIYPAIMSVREVFNDIIKGVEKKGNSFSAGNRNSFIFYVACACNRYGMEIDDVKNKLLASFQCADFNAAEIEKCVENGYKNVSEHGKYEMKEKAYRQNSTETPVIMPTKAEIIEKIKQKNAEINILLKQLEQL